MNVVAVGTVLLVLAGGAVGAYLALQPSEEEKLVVACEAILADRLKAPSTYQRISTTPLSSADATLDQFLGWDAPGARQHADDLALADFNVLDAQERQKELFAAREWTRYSTWIEYDAANAYGTPVRGLAECSLLADKEAPFEISKLSDARVDGFDSLSWTMHQLWLTRQ